MNPQDGQGTQLNPEHVINSLTNQVANLSLGNAQKYAVIRTQQEELQELQQEIGQLKTEAKTPKK